MATAAAESSAGESESVLDSVLSRLWGSSSLRWGPASPLCVAVINVDRYLSDGRDADGYDYDYDVTITDGRCRVKCLLSAGLNRLVRRNALRVGRCVHVGRFRVVHDERRLAHSFVCIEEARVVAHDAATLRAVEDPEALRWWYRDGTARPDAPLRLRRRHYLSLWNNEDPHGAVWVANTTPADVAVDVSKVSLLVDLENFFCSGRRPLPLLVRVLHRSRLRYYGKPGQSIEFPFQAYLEVADQSGVMSMVLWNELCPEWYHRVTVGSVLYLQNYTLKRSYQNRSRPQLGPLLLLSIASIEICLNPRNPAAVVTVIPPRSVEARWSLPDVTYNFCTRSEIESLDSNQACDIIGLVTYVGRAQRIRNRTSSGPEKFWTYRWVHAVDGTSERPFILEIFSSSQPQIFDRLSPMVYLVCTQMRACRDTAWGVYLTSSTETQLFITGCHRKQPYVSEPKVKAFVQWTKTLKDGAVMKKTAVGGYYCYPPAPPTFAPNTTSEGACPALLAVSDLRGELESLQYREHRRVAVQGHVTAVQYRRWPPEAERQLEPEWAAPERSETAPERSETAPERSETAPERSETAPALTEAPERNETLPATPSPKRRRVEEAVRAVQRQYWTRAKVQSDRQTRVGGDESEEGSTRSPQLTDNAQTCSPPRAERPPALPAASWESAAWSTLRPGVTDHLSCPAPDTESVPERFSLDNQGALLRRINLAPAAWSPDPPSDPRGGAHVEFHGYLTLTILGLNREAAVDALFLPVFTPEDPRAAGTTCGLHDDTLISCLSTGRIPRHLSPAALLSSASELEEQKLVCLLDVCLLGDDKLEIVCSKIYRALDILPV